MVTVNELEETINWLSKLQAADAVSSDTFGYSDNTIKLAQKGDKHISTIREGKGFIETINPVGHFPRMKYFEEYIEKLKNQLVHIQQGNEPNMQKYDEVSMNEVYNTLIRILAGIANEILIQKR